jgi:hypothetical protein
MITMTWQIEKYEFKAKNSFKKNKNKKEMSGDMRTP